MDERTIQSWGKKKLSIFTEEGLEQRLQLFGEKAIGDGIYQGCSDASIDLSV